MSERQASAKGGLSSKPENGAGGDDPHRASAPHPFPCTTFKDAAQHLRRPFTVEAVKWKHQPGTKSLVVPYIDARLVIERLNLVCPHLWCEGEPPGGNGNPAYEGLAGGKGLLCRLTIDGITRCDVGEGYAGKGLYSDAFKRAAVKFGVGVSLYALPKVSLSFEDGQLKVRTYRNKKGEEKKETLITEEGRKRLDSGYRPWLKGTGIELFGEALDHGDAADAFGDVEAELAESADQTAAPEAQPEKLSDSKAKGLIAGAEALYKELPKEAKGAKGLTAAAFKRNLESAWHSHEALEKLVADLEKRKAAAGA